MGAIETPADAPPPSTGSVWHSEIPAGCPFPRSNAFSALRFTGRHSDYKVGDTWVPSWASDGNLYSPWTDGTTDGVKCYSNRGAEALTANGVLIGDDPLRLVIRNTSAPQQASALPYEGRYPGAALIHNDIWYYSTYFLDASGHHKHEGVTWNWPILGPVGGFRISRDFGKTWEPSPHSGYRPLFPEPARHGDPVKIGCPRFVDFGRNMEHSPDGLAYLVAHGATLDDPLPRPALRMDPSTKSVIEIPADPRDSFKNGNLSWASADQIYLVRVRPSPETINDVRAYEYYAGNNERGEPRWSREFSQLKPLLEWNNHMGPVSITYVPGLKKYLMCITDGWPTMGPMSSYVLESDHLTGPWKIITYLRNFGEQAYHLNFPSKFISADGKRLWLSYSANYASNWNGYKIRSNPPGSRYGLVLQEVLLEPAVK